MPRKTHEDLMDEAGEMEERGSYDYADEEDEYYCDDEAPPPATTAEEDQLQRQATKDRFVQSLSWATEKALTTARKTGKPAPNDPTERKALVVELTDAGVHLHGDENVAALRAIKTSFEAAKRRREEAEEQKRRAAEEAIRLQHEQTERLMHAAATAATASDSDDSDDDDEEDRQRFARALDIPFDVWRLIMAYLHPVNCAFLAATCQWLHHVVEEAEDVWAEFMGRSHLPFKWVRESVLDDFGNVIDRKLKLHFYSLPNKGDRRLPSAYWDTFDLFEDFPKRGHEVDFVPLPTEEQLRYPWSHVASFRVFALEAVISYKFGPLLTAPLGREKHHELLLKFAETRDKLDAYAWLDLYHRTTNPVLRAFARIMANRYAGMGSIAFSLFFDFDFAKVTPRLAKRFKIPNTPEGIKELRVDLLSASLNSDSANEQDVTLVRKLVFKRPDYIAAHANYGKIVPETPTAKPVRVGTLQLPLPKQGDDEHEDDGGIGRKHIPLTTRGRRELRALMAQLHLSSIEEAGALLYGTNSDRRRALKAAMITKNIAEAVKSEAIANAPLANAAAPGAGEKS